jgi:hypothetical protein
MAGDRQLKWDSLLVRTAIPEQNRRWLVVNALGVTAVINVVVNFVVAWLGTRGAHSIALWATPLKRPSTIADTMGTTFILPFMTTVLCTRAVEREIRTGTIPPLLHDCQVRRLVSRLPKRVLPRALIVASWSALTIGSMALVVLVVTRLGGLSVPSFLMFKVAFAVGLGLVVTPVIALAAMHQAEGSTVRPTAPA